MSDNIVTFSRAVRKGSHVIISLYGMSGSGKTYSGLLLGRGLVGPEGRLGMIDTETGRGMIFADDVPGGYDYAELTPPFTPERYTEAIKAAEAAGFDALVIDSASHLWDGLGGIIEAAEGSKSSSGRALQGLAKWASPKARYKKFIQSLLTTRMHLILCLRAKEKMRQAKDDQGKEVIVSDGFFPIQEKTFIYDTTVQLFMPYTDKARSGMAVVEKCPGALLAAFPDGERLSVKAGEIVREWVNGGEAVDHAFNALRVAGAEAAGEGRDSFTRWWNLPETKKHRARLNAHLANFQSIVKSAEEDRARQDGHDDGVGEQSGGPVDDGALAPRAAAPATGLWIEPKINARTRAVEGKDYEDQLRALLAANPDRAMDIQIANKPTIDRIAKEDSVRHDTLVAMLVAAATGDAATDDGKAAA
ncbi:MAG: AAA family ATPase [Alphaproteobacteria bacterium]